LQRPISQPEEWQVVLEGPPSAGMIVVTAQRGGTFRETIAMAKAYVEARKQHGESELLDEIVSAKPEIDHTRYHSAEELKENGLQHLRDAVELLTRKATHEERWSPEARKAQAHAKTTTMASTIRNDATTAASLSRGPSG
jgi:hypothetical protein